ncbi:MAG: PQQ-binding-like beta-propeller repeat protein [Thermoplasmata archaeon]|nr:MAG: PQQ-binding-like beta-propeller repeat protein [Thermoplasmata archaeon]
MKISILFQIEKLTVFLCLITLINLAVVIPILPTNAESETESPEEFSDEFLTPSDNSARSTSRSGFDWPKAFGGLQNTGVSDTYGPLTNNTLWKYDTEAEVYSSPAVAEGLVFIASWDKNLYAFDAEKGTKEWTFNTGDYVYSSPTYSNGMVFIGTGTELENNVRKLYAVDLDTDPVTTEWEHQFNHNIYGSAVVYKGVVYVCCADGYLYALDAAGNGDGTTDVLGQFQTGDAIWSSPAIDGDSIYITSTNCKLYRLDLETLKETWSFQADYAFEGLFSSPTLDGEGRVFFGSAVQPDGRFYAVDTETGKELWNITTGTSAYGVCSTAAVHNGVVFVGSNNGIMYALNASSGKEIWNYPTGDTNNGIYSSAAIANGHVYFGSCDGYLYCLKEGNGELIWKYAAIGGQYGIVSSPAVVDGRVYFGSNDGFVYAIGLERTGNIQIDLSADPETLLPGENSTITVRTYNGTQPLSRVKVKVEASTGRFSKIDARSTSTRTSIVLGETDPFGYYRCKYTAPDINEFLTIEIKVEASGEGLITNTKSIVVKVNPENKLELAMTPTKSKYFIGEPLKVLLNITESGKPVNSASVNYTILYYGNEYSKNFLWDYVGQDTLEDVAPEVSSETPLIILATARKQGYLPATSSIAVTILPQQAYEFDIKVTFEPAQPVMGKENTLEVEVRNKTGGEVVPGVVLKFHRTGGELSVSEGITGSDGKLSLTYIAPSGLSEPTTYELIVSASRMDFKDTAITTNISVVLVDVDTDGDGEDDSESSDNFFASKGFYIATIVLIIVIIIAVVFLMRARKKRLEIEESEKEDRVEGSGVTKERAKAGTDEKAKDLKK